MKNVKIGRKSIQKVLDKYQGEALVNFILGPYTYKENITINISSANFIGVEGKTKIIINKKERKKEVLFPASTVLVLGSCITFRNIIIESNYKQNGVSLAVFGDNIFLDNCELISNNKSLLLGPLPKDVVEELNESLQNVNTNYPTTTYVNKSKITGSSDYVIGAGTCFFNECEFNNLKEGFVFETLHNSNNPNGFICNKCFFNELTSNILVRSYSYHVSVFLIECLINKNLRPINYENHFSLNYYEYPYLKTDISEEIDKDDLEYFEFVLNNIKRKSKGLDYLSYHRLDKEKRDGVLLLPGGSYLFTSAREDRPVVDLLHSQGFHVIVYHYREQHLLYEELLNEARDFILDINESLIIKKLFVLGFSAGAHLALLLGNKYYYYISKLVLLYPVTTSKRKIAHNESFKYLLGKEEYRLRYKDFYIEKIIHNEMPETFVFHTEDDDIVNVLGVYKLAEAYSKMKVPLHLHVFPKGRHGLSTIEKRVAFIDQSEEEFIKDNDFVKSYISLMIDFLRK